MSPLKSALLISLPVAVVLAVLLEFVFRFGIPAAQPPARYFDKDNLLWVRSSEPSTGTRTIGSFATISARWRINNLGWNYPVDYLPRDERQLIAIIGDSFVEAREVDVDKNFSFLLRESMASSDYEVYAFGRAAAPLSHYLHMARYATRLFDPEVLIFVLYYNDFDESIHDINPGRSHWLTLVADSQGNILEMPPATDVRISLAEKIVLRSATLRYFLMNFDFREVVLKLKRRVVEYTIEENIDLDRIGSVVAPVTEYVVQKLAEENRGRRLIFVMDAPRFDIYHDRLANSRLRSINQVVGEIVERYGAEFIDLTPVMYEDYKENGERFEFDIDIHWNEHAHRLVARTLHSHLVTE